MSEEKKTTRKKTPKMPKKPVIEYLENPATGVPDPQMGIKYDWNLIRKAYKSLGCPDDVYDPTVMPLEIAKYFHLASSRSVGKTTNILLLGMCMHELYGTQLVYIRQHESAIERKYLDSSTGLFTAIKTWNYASKITDGRWNSVEYYARVWRYVNRDDTGKIIEKCPTSFMTCVSIDQTEQLRSTFSATNADYIIVDELISKDYRFDPPEFIDLCQLIKTIIRDRLSPIIITLFNNFDIYSPWLREFDIKDAFAPMSEGENAMVKTRKGTPMYCEFIGALNKARPFVNSAYFGFDNALITSITGGGGWAIEPCPRIFRDETREILQKRIYIVHQDNILELEICKNDSVGLHICVHHARKIMDDALVIYTVEAPRKPREVYGFGHRRPIDDIVWGLFQKNLWYFADEDCAAITNCYWAEAK